MFYLKKQLQTLTILQPKNLIVLNMYLVLEKSKYGWGNQECH